MACKCNRKAKKLPYGAKRTRHWCGKCDRNLVAPVSKGAERQNAKRSIQKELKEMRTVKP